jgi:hypothetical protein
MDQLSAPSAAHEQRMRSLALANAVRARRSELWARFKDLGRQDACLEAARLVEDPPAFLATCRLELLLSGIPTLGKIKAAGRGGRGVKQRRWMLEFGISRTAQMGQLTTRQRDLIAERLRAYSDPAWWTLERQRQRDRERRQERES